MEVVGLGKMSTGVSLKRDPCEVVVGVAQANHGTLTYRQIHPMHA